MRKSEIEQLRRDMVQGAKDRALDALRESKREKAAAEAAKSAEAEKHAQNAQVDRGIGPETLQALIYANLVGSSDFLRTQAGVAEICRTAYARSETAIRIWLKEKGTGDDQGTR